MVERRTLTPLILVRIQVPQPILSKTPYFLDFRSCRISFWHHWRPDAQNCSPQVMLTIFETGRRSFFAGIGGDVGGGRLLFALVIGLWTVGLFGAGDAKHFLPIGLLSGCNGMLPFAICSVGRTLF